MMEGYELDFYCVAFQIPKHLHSELNWVVCFYNIQDILGYLPGLKLLKILRYLPGLQLLNILGYLPGLQLLNILGYMPGLQFLKISSDICQVSNFWYLFFHSKSSFLLWQACYSIRPTLIFIVNHHLDHSQDQPSP